MKRHGASTATLTVCGDKARHGEIILRRPLRRAVFIAGLVGAAALGLLIA